jgi:hypothetical protein
MALLRDTYIDTYTETTSSASQQCKQLRTTITEVTVTVTILVSSNNTRALVFFHRHSLVSVSVTSVNDSVLRHCFVKHDCLHILLLYTCYMLLQLYT